MGGRKHRQVQTPQGRAQGRPLRDWEISRIIECYKGLRERRHPHIRETIHEAFGVSTRKIAELIKEFKETGMTPEPKQKIPWNKGMVMTATAK